MPSDLPHHAQVPEGGKPASGETMQVSDPEGGKKELDKVEETDMGSASVEVFIG